jgi:RNA polymerase sigma factor (sigma-70 family)
LDEGLVGGEPPSFDLVALDEALGRLEQIDAEQARLVELRFFGGLTIEETAEAMNISPATVKRHWTLARAWLARELAGDRTV